ncbi:MAG: zeta toxin family protein [Ahrensia sp.]|nr:zeta toxin family protein [Ahrensia sp.]
MPSPRPTLIILAGPNGAGKTTLFETRIAPFSPIPFINADIIQRNLLKSDQPEAAYEAARMAQEQRQMHFERRQSFATETVFSHPSKLGLIRQAQSLNYRVTIIHIGLELPQLSVARVNQRVEDGGHFVPEQKIHERFERNGPLIRRAVIASDKGQVVDNSILNKQPRPIIHFERGRIRSQFPPFPKWVQSLYGEDLNKEGS